LPLVRPLHLARFPSPQFLTWGVFDSTNGQKITIESVNTAAVVGAHLLQVFLYTNDSQGVGSSTLGSMATRIQCGYKAIHSNGKGVVISK
jgi:hypothetical protein